jgi:UDP-N-acetylmuramoyl-tripeptide--D-alanyl-D-alanine ligase
MMKQILKKQIEKRLASVARLIIAKHKPKIIGITGSVGKTTTREAIKFVLATKYNVYAPEGSYNTEIGLPLAVIGSKSPSNIFNLFAWLVILIKGYLRVIDKKYPHYLILEMGVDAPGDMDKLLKIAVPDISVITAIAPVHIENFKTLEAIREEKLKLASAAKSKVILNKDQVEGKKFKVPVVSYGTKGDVFFTDLKQSIEGISFTLKYKNYKENFEVGVLGSHSIYSILAAVAVGLEYGLGLKEISGIFKNYKPYPGRMNIFKGINGSTVIDDTYNASPEGVKAALDSIKEFKGRKILALGSMNELGDMEESAHREIGKVAAGIAEVIITVGEAANNFLAEEAVASGFKKDKVYKFLSSRKAGKFAIKIIKKGDIVFCKGSQNKIFMEEFVKEVLLYRDDKRFLVRQSSFWASKKNKFFKQYKTN